MKSKNVMYYKHYKHYNHIIIYTTCVEYIYEICCVISFFNVWLFVYFSLKMQVNDTK